MSDYCPCGGIILADTEQWETPVCYECWNKCVGFDVPSFLKKLARTERALEKCKEQRDNFMERDFDGEQRVACDVELAGILEGK